MAVTAEVDPGTIGARPAAARRWATLVLERFPPGAYLPMVCVFVIANGAVAARAVGAHVDAVRLIVAGLIALSFFFRLRLFDEIKDYEVDLAVNPTRPLARGLIAVDEVKRALYALTAFEMVAALALSPRGAATHSVAILYSYLMYNEFFIGPLIRPRLTTYAVMHTAVSVALGLSVASLALGRPLFDLPVPVLTFALANWMLFNVFEFARKTFAPDEERPHVESYSKIFGPLGAAILTVSQVAIALLLLAQLEPGLLTARGLAVQGAAAAAFATSALAYGLRPRRALARAYRGLAGLYILAFFAAVAIQLLLHS